MIISAAHATLVETRANGEILNTGDFTGLAVGEYSAILLMILTPCMSVQIYNCAKSIAIENKIFWKIKNLPRHYIIYVCYVNNSTMRILKSFSDIVLKTQHLAKIYKS